MVPYRVLKDTLEQHRPFRYGPVSVFFGEAHHRILDDVKRSFLVPDGKHGLFEGASLYAGKEVGKFSSGTQG